MIATIISMISIINKNKSISTNHFQYQKPTTWGNNRSLYGEYSLQFATWTKKNTANKKYLNNDQVELFIQKIWGFRRAAKVAGWPWTK